MTMGKKFIALGMYESGRLQVFFNTCAEGVVIPEHVRAYPQGQFDYGAELPIPIPDLVIDDSGISATLSFNRTPFKTFLPWGAVFLMMAGTADMRGHMAWPKDMPQQTVEAKADAQVVAGGAGSASSLPAKRERPDWLKLVD